MVSPGWLTVYGRTTQDEGATLPAVTPSEQVSTLDVHADALQTKPPARFSEATLLSAMEGAGKLVEDEELRAAMEAAIRSRKPTLINAVIDETAGTESGRITSLNPTAKKK